jgi:hypothetical protein
MLAYKFRSAAQVPYALDIVLNQRLYCSDKSAFNDPQEGAFLSMFWESQDRNTQAIKDVLEAQTHLRICSLTRTCEFIPLWAYYASGFSGLAIEVELPDDAPEIRDVRYTNDRSIGLLHVDDTKRGALESLCMKREEWSLEQEVRVIFDGRNLATTPYYPLTKPVSHIIVGGRMERALLDVIRALARDHGILLSAAGLGREGFVRVPLKL